MHHYPLGLGLLLILMAGTMVGTCMAPLNSIRVWRWENAWLCFSLVSLVLVPGVCALFTIPDLPEVYRSASLWSFALTFLFGAGWGIAQILFGISVVRLGMALAFAIIVGLGALIGTVVPLAIQNPGILLSSRGALVLCGTALMLAGISACCYAGIQRASKSDAGKAERGSALGLILAILSGLTAGMLNLSLAFGRNFAVVAEQHGANPFISAYAIWPVALLGGFIPNAVYSVFLLRKNHSWILFARSRNDLLLSIAMGLLWIGAVLLYSSAARLIGILGTSAGWALYQICMILVANASGIVAGEWQGADQASKRTLSFGLVSLVGATALIAAAAA